jgi:hypothetical protein
MLGSAILSIKVLGVIPLVCSLVLTLLTIKMFHYVHIGKLRLRDRLLALAGFQGHETVLDVGTGRGLLMIAAARMLPNGKSVGIDIWSQEDMKDNNPKDTLRNAERWAMAGADMNRGLPRQDPNVQALKAQNRWGVMGALTGIRRSYGTRSYQPAGTPAKERRRHFHPGFQIRPWRMEARKGSSSPWARFPRSWP